MKNQQHSTYHFFVVQNDWDGSFMWFKNPNIYIWYFHTAIILRLYFNKEIVSQVSEVCNTWSTVSKSIRIYALLHTKYICKQCIYIYTAGQLLRMDNTIIHSNHKMKRSKMWKIRISAGYSKKRCAYATFHSHVCSSCDSVHKSFKGFDACGHLLF